MKRIATILAAATTALLLTACASTPGQADTRTAAKEQAYLEHAGEPVESIRLFGRLNSWSSVSDHKLVVRTGVNDSYLLTVDPTCTNLEFAHSIALTTTGSRVQTGFDYVRFDDGFMGQRCRITDIRPVDAKAASQALKNVT
jgi:hypothetical protein